MKDDTEAAKFYRLAATQGQEEAQYNLGLMYDKGQGVVQDYAEALKWYRLAAAQGDSSAQVNLGGKYFRGQAVLKDFVRAHMWYDLAGAESNRDVVAKQMTPEQIAEAQKLARECQAKNFKGCD